MFFKVGALKHFAKVAGNLCVDQLTHIQTNSSSTTESKSGQLEILLQRLENSRLIVDSLIKAYYFPQNDIVHYYFIIIPYGPSNPYDE